MSKKALIAMSGGVDSSVAAAMMQEQGYDCIGVTMKLHESEEEVRREKACCTQEDAEDARQVAYSLGMKFYVFNYTREFSAQVIDRFVDAYEKGYTPNPCIDCNRYMKFARLYEQGRLLGYDTIATGHYARVEQDAATGKWKLKKARFLPKDQSYVLYFLTQEQLAHTRFPLGEVESKEAARQYAETHGFYNARKHDSQDICFVEDGKYADFIRQRTGRDYAAGDFVDTAGQVLGRHKGLIGYTVGQRKGLGLALPAPLYVLEKDMAKNRVVLAPETALYSAALLAEDVNWISGETPAAPVRAAARTRYSAREAAATLVPLEDNRVRVVFDQPQRAITPGQAVVFYAGDEVLGGGTIVRAEKE